MWGRKNKYGNKPVTDHPAARGLRFDSTGEFKRWCDLKMLERGLFIKNLRRQVNFDLEINGIHICQYRADYAYDERIITDWVPVVEDFKSPATTTPIFAIKRKLMQACHGIEVRVTGRGSK